VHGRDELGTSAPAVMVWRSTLSRSALAGLVVTQGAPTSRSAERGRYVMTGTGPRAPVVALVDVLDHLFARPDSMSTSMSGGPSRAGDKKRSKNRFNHASGVLMPKEKQTAESGRAAALAVDVVTTTNSVSTP